MTNLSREFARASFSPELSPEMPKRSCWVDGYSCSSLCQLMMADWPRSPRVSCSPQRRRPPLPPAIYSQHIAPFLRFEGCLPGMLYAFGGRNRGMGALNSVEMLDTWHGCWLPCPAMPKRRAGSAAAPLPDGRIMVLGGYDERGIVDGLLASCDLYDPTTEAWLAEGAAPLQRPRWGHGCAALRGRIYAVGGCSLAAHASYESAMETLRSCEAYDPVRNRWEPVASLQVPRSGCRVVAVADRYLAAVGGCDDVFGRAQTQATVELYDVETGRWEVLEQNKLVVPRTSAAVAAVDGDRLLIAGGAPSVSAAEVFRLPRRLASQEESVNAASELLPDMAEGRMGCQAAIVSLPHRAKDHPWKADGADSDSSESSTRQKDVVPPTPLDLQSDGYFRCVLVVGGERGEEEDESAGARQPRQLNSCIAFDLNAGTWCHASKAPSLCVARTTTALCVAGGRVWPQRLGHLS